MLQKLHKNAKTNYSIRKEIKESDLSISALAEKFKKTVDEIYLTLEKEIPNLYPQKIYRCVRRYGLSPKIAKKRYYIFTSIDRVSKVGFLWISTRKTKEMGARFLRKVLTFYPYKAHYILTDNGFEFSYKSLPKGKKTKKIHPFDLICQENKIEHRTIKFKHPWTNGMVERFNGNIKSKVFRRYILTDHCDLEKKLIEYLNRYNFEVRLKQIDYLTPADFLKNKFNKSIQPIVC